jgi:hypothetical protein
MTFQELLQQYKGNLASGLATGLGGAAAGYTMSPAKGEYETPEEYAQRRRRAALMGGVAGGAGGLVLPEVYAGLQGLVKDPPPPPPGTQGFITPEQTAYWKGVSSKIPVAGGAAGGVIGAAKGWQNYVNKIYPEQAAAAEKAVARLTPAQVANAQAPVNVMDTPQEVAMKQNVATNARAQAIADVKPNTTGWQRLFPRAGARIEGAAVQGPAGVIPRTLTAAEAQALAARRNSGLRAAGRGGVKGSVIGYLASLLAQKPIEGTINALSDPGAVK